VRFGFLTRERSKRPARDRRKNERTLGAGRENRRLALKLNPDGSGRMGTVPRGTSQQRRLLQNGELAAKRLHERIHALDGEHRQHLR